MDRATVFEIILMLICVLLSGFFSASETAFLSMNKLRIRTLAEKGNKRASCVLDLDKRSDGLLSTILIGNNLVNILLASLGTVVFLRMLGNIGTSVSTVVITVVVLIFGEVTPKFLAKEIPERFALFSAPVLRVIMIVFSPLNWLFSHWKGMLSRYIRLNTDDRLSQEELITFVDEAREEGSIDSDEGDLLKNVINFSDRKAEDILTHRVDIEAVSVRDSKAAIAQKFAQTRFSRLLVYEGSIDHIVGVIHQKDFYNEKGITPLPVRKILTQPLFVTRDARIHDLMRALQNSQSHVAVVLDEYGGTYGIVTLEDILEELVGEIWDEHDDVVVPVKKTSENEYSVDCMMPIEDFADFFGIELQSESVLLSGWVMERLGKVPEVGDGFVFGHLSVTVTEMDAHRVARVTVKKTTDQ